MRSFTVHSGAMAEILDSLQGKVAASLVPRQYGWVLVTLIFAVLV